MRMSMRLGQKRKIGLGLIAVAAMTCMSARAESASKVLDFETHAAFAA